MGGPGGHLSPPSRLPEPQGIPTLPGHLCEPFIVLLAGILAPVLMGSASAQAWSTSTTQQALWSSVLSPQLRNGWS